MTKELEKGIIEQLPQIPYVIDQVAEALNWAREELDEGTYKSMIGVTYDVAMYIKSISDPNFFKVHYVIATILSYIEGAEKHNNFEKFKSASGAVESVLGNLIVNTDNVQKYGCFKSLSLHLIPMANNNTEVFTIGLIQVKHDLQEILSGMRTAKVKTPITSKDYISILGYALLMANLRMANVNMNNEAYKIYNEIMIMLNNDFNY